MKIKTAGIVFLFILSSLAAHPAMADDAFSKLGRGFENVVTSPIEYWTQFNVRSEKSMLQGLVLFPLTGTIAALTRVLVGVYDIVTFPVPFPKNYKPVIEPETPWEGWKSLAGGTY